MEVLELDSGDDIERVNDISETLAHFPAVRITDQTVAVHLLEGNLPSHFQAEHNHAGNPEEKNIPSSLQDGGGIQGLEIVRLLRPAQGAEWPKTR